MTSVGGLASALAFHRRGSSAAACFELHDEMKSEVDILRCGMEQLDGNMATLVNTVKEVGKLKGGSKTIGVSSRFTNKVLEFFSDHPYCIMSSSLINTIKNRVKLLNPFFQTFHYRSMTKQLMT